MREMNKELKKDRESKKSRSFFGLATIFGYYGINVKMQVAKKVHENKQKKSRNAIVSAQFMVGVRRFELRASWSRTKRATSCATPRCFLSLSKAFLL